MKIKVLVTGVAGFIGAHVAADCIRRGYDVVGLDDLSGGFNQNIPNGVDFVKGSITDTDLVNRIFKKNKFEYVYHIAAYAAEGLSHFIRLFNYQNNLLGSINLINASVINDIKCFVFTSSIAVYGKNQLPMKEDLVPQPEDPYGVSKYSVELDLRCAHEMFGLNYVIFRPHNVYGELQNISDKYRNVIGIFMNQLLQGKPMTIFGDGLQTRAFSYVGDIIRPIVESATMPPCYGEVFNIGADQPYTVLELAHEVARAINAKPKIVHLPDRNEVRDAYASHAKLKTFFSEQPQTTLVEGLSKMAEWVKRVGVREQIVFKNIEILRNLPGSWVENGK